MTYAFKLFRRSTDHWQTTKIKQQLYWVLIITAGLFIVVRGLSMIASFGRGEQALAEQPAATAADQTAVEQAAEPKTPETAVAAPAAPEDAKPDDSTPTAALPHQQAEPAAAQDATEAQQIETSSPSPPQAVIVSEREIAGAIFSPARPDTIAPAEADRGAAIGEEVRPAAADAQQTREALLFLFGGPAAEEGSAADRDTDVDPQANNWVNLLVGRAHETVEAVVESSPATNDEPASATQPLETLAETAEKTQTIDSAAPTEDLRSEEQSSEPAAEIAPPADESSASRPEQEVRIAEELVLVNPSDSGGEVRYLLNEYSFMMPPGHSQRLAADRDWQIRFHRGGGFADAELVLRSGVYEFRADEGGWKLQSADEAVAGRR
jgi:hypothetical protein